MLKIRGWSTHAMGKLDLNVSNQKSGKTEKERTRHQFFIDVLGQPSW